MRVVADAATSSEGIELKDIKITNSYSLGNSSHAEGNRDVFDFTFTYTLTKILHQGLTWLYFNKTFTKITAAKAKLAPEELNKWHSWHMNFDIARIYSEFRLFLLLFVRYLESFQRKSCAAFLMLLEFKFEQNCCPC